MYPILQAKPICTCGISYICSKKPRNESSIYKLSRASLSCDVGEQPKIYLAYRTNYPILQAKPICTCGVSYICSKKPRNESSTSYLGQVYAVILVNSPRSTQHTKQCTPYFRLNPFVLVALAIYVAKSQEMNHLLAI